MFALLAFFLYFNFVNLTQAWVGSSRLPAGTAMLVLHGGVFVLAVALMWWRDHAAVWRWQRAPHGTAQVAA